jgi:hypothetical protein
VVAFIVGSKNIELSQRIFRLLKLSAIAAFALLAGRRDNYLVFYPTCDVCGPVPYGATCADKVRPLTLYPPGLKGPRRKAEYSGCLNFRE